MPPSRTRSLLLLASLSLASAKLPAKSANSELAKILHRPLRGLAYPEFSSMGIFFALSVPLEDPEKTISFSYLFEASYPLPSNYTYFEPWGEPFARRRRDESSRIDRATVYRVLENRFDSAGWPARECLLRTICETAEFPLRHNGVIGDILHVIFTPSSSRREELSRDIVDAELVGRNGTCVNYQQACPVSLFDLIGVLV